MGYVDAEHAEPFFGSGAVDAPVIYVIDLSEQPFDVKTAARGCAAIVVRVPVQAWSDSLTPWPAPALRAGDAGFGGAADETYAELANEAIPAVETRFGLTPARRAICGYSLGGLFSLYAFARDVSFSACACLSGSLWYPGWVDHFRNLSLEGTDRYVYFSIGRKERKAGPRIMRSVQDDTEACVQICRERGCTVDYVLGPGNHMQHHTERLSAGLLALDAHLAASS